jgi:hypothetical protein
MSGWRSRRPGRQSREKVALVDTGEEGVVGR